MMLCMGLVYAWSIFVAPLEEDFGWIRTETSFVFTLSMIFFCLSSLGGGILERKIGYRWVVLAAAAFFLVGFVSASRVQSLTGIYIAYGVFCGTGVGLSYAVTQGAVLSWFPDKTGLVSGAMLMGFGLGGMLLGSGATALIAWFGWRATFLLLGVVSAAFMTFSAFFVRPAGKEELLLLPQPAREPDRDKGSRPETTPRQLLSSPSFQLLFLRTAVLNSVGLVVIGNAAPCATDIGASAVLATFSAGLVSVFNGGGRVVFGAAFDRLGAKRAYSLNIVCVLAALIVLMGALQFHSVALLLFGYVLAGMSYGGVPALNSAYLNWRHGKKYFSVHYGVVNMTIIPSSFIGPALAGWIRVTTGSYFNIFLLLLALTAATVLFSKKINLD